jgi:hypothetical protein
MPAWMQSEGAWIAIGGSMAFVVAGVVMHRVFCSILQQLALKPVLVDSSHRPPTS